MALLAQAWFSMAMRTRAAGHLDAALQAAMSSLELRLAIAQHTVVYYISRMFFILVYHLYLVSSVFILCRVSVTASDWSFYCNS